MLGSLFKVDLDLFDGSFGRANGGVDFIFGFSLRSVPLSALFLQIIQLIGEKDGVKLSFLKCLIYSVFETSFARTKKPDRST